ncbi:c-type cytochrome [Pedobacter arcticus]|uniref:c-type cytochrome n=1 Tax=Pedobacter arcticus TaxID=752140 RepID=UPI0002EB9F4E|nr:cytochrome c [Pedobacter arcticus]
MKKFLGFTLLLSIVTALTALGQQKATPPVSAETMLKGKAVYQKYCLSCHQADGGGVPNLNPPLIKTTYVLGDQTRLINILLKGMSTGVIIDDEEYTNPMPPLNFLSDEQVADVLTYVRNNFQNKASEITAGQVKIVRAKK